MKTLLLLFHFLLFVFHFSLAQPAGRMQWFADARLGIFIHWGIYAVDGIDQSWSFYNELVTYEQYIAQKAVFTAATCCPT